MNASSSITSPTKSLADMTAEELNAAYRRVLEELLVFEIAPYDVPLPDEFFVGRASLVGRAFDIQCELARRQRWGRVARSEPPLPPPEW